jgi:hypothetical protein
MFNVMFNVILTVSSCMSVLERLQSSGIRDYKWKQALDQLNNH